MVTCRVELSIAFSVISKQGAARLLVALYAYLPHYTHIHRMILLVLDLSNHGSLKTMVKVRAW